MNNTFLDLCCNVIEQYTRFTDVAKTAKDINDGVGYARLYTTNQTEFNRKHDEIVDYIIKVRDNNILDSYIDDRNYLLLIPVKSGKPLNQSSPQELCNNLTNEINRLIIKGSYQVIKHIYPNMSDIEVLQKLLMQDISALQEYGLV